MHDQFLMWFVGIMPSVVLRIILQDLLLLMKTGCLLMCPMAKLNNHLC
jgi:hypothetical protein